jgi:hypothetical protein
LVGKIRADELTDTLVELLPHRYCSLAAPGSLAALFSFIGVATPLPYRPSSDLAYSHHDTD